MEPIFIPGQGLVLDGHLTTEQAAAKTRAWASQQGKGKIPPELVPALTAAADVTATAAKTRHAWYDDGGQLGFVGVGHERAREVTVITVGGRA